MLDWLNKKLALFIILSVVTYYYRKSLLDAVIVFFALNFFNFVIGLILRDMDSDHQSM
ncbi:hypothetical protein [uncultured Arcobacter sp.]|uniref:hypothetical protein n=1 Tax=uncultured Arcobacter sp. TaxID=165434 RepID=UPI0026234243|nr:hypothetical protein [uncultured Arcobacter sp.]